MLTKAMAAVTLIAGLGFCFAPSKLAAASAPPPGTVSPLGRAPNWFHDHLPPGTQPGGGSDISNQTAAFADPINNLLYEFNAYAGSSSFGCTNLVRLDIDSYAVKAVDGRSTPTGCAPTVNVVASAGSDAAILGVDSTDRLLFTEDGTFSTITALAEGTLDKQFAFPVPALGVVHDPTGIVQPTLFGISWYGIADELIVFTGYPTVPDSYGVAAYDVRELMTARENASPLWTAPVPACQVSLQTKYGTAAPYRTSNGKTVLVPCSLVNPNDPGGSTVPERDGVVSIPLTTAGCAVAGHACPSSAPQAVAPSPGVLNDVYFDPGSDRMFMPSTYPSGVALLTFDGDSGAFAGRASLGSESTVSMGLDTGSGRLYSVGGQTGMTVLDGRLTPVSPGSVFQAYATNVLKVPLVALGPDGRNPYRRVVVPPTISNSTPYFLVYADTQTAGANLPPNSVDANTLTGPVPPGAVVTTAYSGSAAAYGYHDDFVGGVNAIVSDFSEGSASASAPFTGSSDLLGADIRRLSVDSTNGTDGVASALGDGSGATSGSYEQCSGTSAVACVPPPPCPQSGSGVPCAPAPGQPPVTAGGQPWPFPEAQCVAPGTTQSGEANGAYGSTGGNAQQVPGSDSQNTAHAFVNCAAGNGAKADAELGQASTSAAELPGVSMGYASSATTITPGAAGTGLTTTATASATGVSIDLGGNVTIKIGDVLQTATTSAGGTVGSATTKDLVTVSHIYVNGQDECTSSAGDCSAAIAQINSQFPTLIKIIERPAADTRYADNCVADASNPNQMDCQGSPGGYLASVEADLGEQYGDQQFNGMSEEESTLLPAMRIILYGTNDGIPSLSRQIIDLAGVLATASQGLQAIPTSSDSGSGGPVASFSQPGCSSCAGLPSIPVASAAASPGPGGIVGTVERILSGLNWLVRHPGEVLQMAAFLTLLGLPIMLMRRRWHAGMKEGAVA